MTTTLMETSRRSRRDHFADGLDCGGAPDLDGRADPFEARHQLIKIVDVAVSTRGVELLSAGLDPVDGSIRIELLAPTLTATQQLALGAWLRGVATQDSRNGGLLNLEFVDPSRA